MSVKDERLKTNAQDTEASNIFPSLQMYKEEHSTLNFQKVCVDLIHFCKDLYASTQSEKERQIYNNTIDKLVKK